MLELQKFPLEVSDGRRESWIYHLAFARIELNKTETYILELIKQFKIKNKDI